MWKINPIVKFVSILAAAMITAFSFSWKWSLMIVLFCLVLMLVSRVDMKRLLLVMIPVSLAALSLFFAIYLNGRGNDASAIETGTGFYSAATHGANLNGALSVAVRIYAYAFMGLLFVLTTRTEDFLYSLMQQAHVKPIFAYGIMAACNLIPVIQREMKQIRLAYRVRGIRVGLLSLRTAFSTLVNTMHWSESLAMAMESKGFDEDGERTMYMTFSVKKKDMMFAAALIALAAAGVIGI